jgi:protein phosphatase PTC7
MSDSKCEASYDVETLMSEEIVKKLLIKSAKLTKSSGTSTCTILMLDKFTGKIFSTFVGDSRYLILRYDTNKAKFYRYFISEEQMHDELFNTPYQIGKKGDDPAKAISHTHELKNNDMVILATDGLWDNLEISQIIEIVNVNYKSLLLLSPKELAVLIAEKAKKNSNNK